MGIWIPRVVPGRVEEVLRGKVTPDPALGHPPLKRSVTRVRWSPTHDIAVRLIEEIADAALAKGHSRVKLSEEYSAAKLDTDGRSIRNAKQILESLGLIDCVERSIPAVAAAKLGVMPTAAIWTIHPVLLQDQQTKHKNLTELRRFCRNRNGDPDDGEKDFGGAWSSVPRGQRRTTRRVARNLSLSFPEKYPGEPSI